MSVEPQAVGWSRSTAARRLAARRTPPQLRLWLWAWVLWLMLAAAFPPLGVVVGAVLALAHKALGAAMVTVATVSAVWMAAAYFSR